MAAASASPARLYPHLLRDAWHALPERVRSFHTGDSPFKATGCLRVRHGTCRPARFCAWLARLPTPGDAITVCLTVQSSVPGAEHWQRSFGGQPLLSYQSARADGILIEDWGLLELRFQLAVQDGALLYIPRGAALRVGPLRIPLPRIVAPAITASERVSGSESGIQIRVEASMPLVGVLMTYEGTVARVEVPA